MQLLGPKGSGKCSQPVYPGGNEKALNESTAQSLPHQDIEFWTGSYFSSAL